MNKKLIWSTVGVAVVIVILALVLGNKPQTGSIKIGAVYPLTGGKAYMGVEYKRGVEMAVDEINNVGGINGKKIDVIYEDDGGDSTKAVTAVNKFISVDKVNFVFTAFSPTANATAPIAEQNKTVYFNASTVKIGNGSYVFKDYWDIGLQGEAIAKAIKKEGIKKLGILEMIHPATAPFMEALNNELKGYPIDIHKEDFNVGSMDYGTQLAKIKNLNPDAILVFSSPGNDSINIFKQIVKLQMDNIRFFGGSSAFRSAAISTDFSSSLTKMKAIETRYNIDTNNSKANDFGNKYKRLYSTDLNGDAAYPYDDVNLIAQVLKEVGVNADPKTVADQLRKSTLDGVAGNMSFDGKGNSIRPAYLEIYRDGNWIKYEQ